jgi:hypothetical protein
VLDSFVIDLGKNTVTTSGAGKPVKASKPPSAKKKR